MFKLTKSFISSGSQMACRNCSLKIDTLFQVSKLTDSMLLAVLNLGKNVKIYKEIC